MIDRAFIRWNALLLLVTLALWLGKLLLGPSEQPKDPKPPEPSIYHAQRHEALGDGTGREPLKELAGKQTTNPNSASVSAAERVPVE